MKLEAISEWPTELHIIADGSDSEVRRFGDKVVKIYRYTSRSLEDIQRYAEITNQASELLQQSPFEMKLPSDPEPIEGFYEVVPVEQVGLSPEGYPSTVSQYVQGANLCDISRGYFFASTKLLDPREQAPLEEAMREYLSGGRSQEEAMREYLSGGRSQRDLSPDSSKPLTPDLNDLTWYLKGQLGVSGINIEPLNAKMRWDVEAQRLRIVVTDLASFVYKIFEN